MGLEETSPDRVLKKEQSQVKYWGCLLRSQACHADDSGQLLLHTGGSCVWPGFSSIAEPRVLWGGQSSWEL